MKKFMKKKMLFIATLLIAVSLCVQFVYAGGQWGWNYCNFTVSGNSFYNYTNVTIDGTGAWGLGTGGLPLGGVSGTFLSSSGGGSYPANSLGIISRLWDSSGNMINSTSWIYNSTTASSVSGYATASGLVNGKSYWGDGQTAVVLSGMAVPAFIPTYASPYISYP